MLLLRNKETKKNMKKRKKNIKKREKNKNEKGGRDEINKRKRGMDGWMDTN